MKRDHTTLAMLNQGFDSLILHQNIKESVGFATRYPHAPHKMDTRRHIIKGLQSGFPPCCIAYYLARNRICDFLAKDIVFTVADAECKLRDLLHKTHNIWHIQCPYHMLKEPKPEYYYCVPCDWYQRADKHCFKCGKRIKRMRRYKNAQQ